MQFRKKRLSVVFAVCLVFSLLSLPLLAFAQEPCFDEGKLLAFIKCGFGNAGSSAAVQGAATVAEKGSPACYPCNFGYLRLIEKQWAGSGYSANTVKGAGCAAGNTGMRAPQVYSACNAAAKPAAKQASGTGAALDFSAGSRAANTVLTGSPSAAGTFVCSGNTGSGTLAPGTFYKVIRYRISIPLSPSKPVPQPAPQPGPTPPPSVNPPDPAPKPVPPPSPPPAKPNPAPPSGGVTYNADELKMLDLVNKERAANGLKPLAMDPQLVKLARMKAQDMIDNRYFAHESPTYGSPFDMMRKYGVTYRAAGENLAGASTVDSAHVNLMNSPGHRANILSPNYTRVGIGVVNGGPYGKMFVQMFIG
ncbi:MAG: CAP domain-containing protein [Bacillota bacterium]